MDFTVATEMSLSSQNSTMLLFKRDAYLATYHHHQKWSLPDSIIYYVTKNPSSSRCYEKMIQSCKYFFIKNPIVIAEYLNFTYVNNEWYAGRDREYVYNLSCKLWITQLSDIYNRNANFQNISFTFPKIYQSDIKELKIWNQNISLNLLKLLTPKCEEIFFKNIDIIDEDGSSVVLEKIFEALSNVTYLWFELVDDTRRNVVTSKTAKELIKIPHFVKLNSFILDYIPEQFDIDSFYDYIKKNKKTKIWLDFTVYISDAYKNRLQTIINEILASENRNFKVPYIRFPLNDLSASQKLLNLYYDR